MTFLHMLLFLFRVQREIWRVLVVIVRLLIVGYKMNIRYAIHRHFLALDHKWRNKKSKFNGKKERKTTPKRLSGDDVLK